MGTGAQTGGKAPCPALPQRGLRLPPGPATPGPAPPARALLRRRATHGACQALGTAGAGGSVREQEGAARGAGSLPQPASVEMHPPSSRPTGTPRRCLLDTV